MCPRGYADDSSTDGRIAEAMQVSHALARSADFDLVHSHLDWLPLAFAQHCRAPSRGAYDGLTLHGPNVNQGAESTRALISTLQHRTIR